MKILLIHNCDECNLKNICDIKSTNKSVFPSDCPLETYERPLMIWINKMFKYAASREWYETYWFIDLHQTIIKPNYIKNSTEIEFYPYAKETLQLLSQRDDIILSLYTSSYPEQIEETLKKLEHHHIHFNHVNKNPDVSDKAGSFGCYDEKPYFNVLLDDKAGFDANIDWRPLYEYLKNTNYKPNIDWKKQ